MKSSNLLGPDYAFPRTANAVLKAYLASVGVPAENIIEEYTPFSHQDYQSSVARIRDFSTSGKAAVMSTINGDSNVPFYKSIPRRTTRLSKRSKTTRWPTTYREDRAG